MKLWNTTEFIDENALQVNIARLQGDETGWHCLQVKSVRGWLQARRGTSR